MCVRGLPIHEWIKGGPVMARKTVERNISYDDIRHLYYVSMDLGKDEHGKRIKQYRTFPTLSAARNGLK